MSGIGAWSYCIICRKSTVGFTVAVCVCAKAECRAAWKNYLFAKGDGSVLDGEVIPDRPRAPWRVDPVQAMPQWGDHFLVALTRQAVLQ